MKIVTREGLRLLYAPARGAATITACINKFSLLLKISSPSVAHLLPTLQTMIRLFVLSVLFAGWWVQASAQGEIYSRTYMDNIRTVRCYTDGLELTLPLITMGGNDQLVCSFDDLDGDQKSYYATIILCNQDWTPSTLPTFEYIDGFESIPLMQYQYSFATLARYTHYEFRLPQVDMTPSLPGNYIIKVYLDDDTSQVAFTQRFYVQDNKVRIQGMVRQPNDLRHRQTHQEVDFSVLHPGYDISNPFQEVFATIMQNNREDNAVIGLKPTFVQDQKLVYDYEEENLFEAMKEFRWVNLQSLMVLDERTKLVEMLLGQQHAFVAEDNIRSYEQYFYRRDINGRFIINVREERIPTLNADYVVTHFTLPFQNELPSGELYIMGGFNNWQATDENKLVYNPQRNAYEGTLLLKQGFYNYLYAYRQREGAPLDFDLIEGNYFETENDYTILIYHRPFGQLYDALIGVHTLNTLLN